MTIYSVRVHNDMGHLICSSSPKNAEVEKFAYEKISNKFVNATDKDGFGAHYYFLKSGLQPTFQYHIQHSETIITINYEIPSIDTIDLSKYRVL